MQDFSLLSPRGDGRCRRASSARFEDAFARVWSGEMESDGFNRLILLAGLDWRQVTVLRLYAKVMRQAGSAFSQAYMEDTLAQSPGDRGAARRPVRAPLRSRRAPHRAPGRDERMRQGDRGRSRCGRRASTRTASSAASCTLVAAIAAHQLLPAPPDGAQALSLGEAREPRDRALPAAAPALRDLRLSPRMEGVHLRGGKVARGGIRWSDRKEDFRTEILGLMKAQMVKNAVIVPTGSKGGFVVKRPPAQREALQAEVVECYTTLMRGMLDITDNIVGGKIVPPRGHRCATTATIPISSSPPTRAPRPSPTSPTASPRNTASGSATPSPRAARTATTTRRWASPRAAPGRRSSAISASSATTSRRRDFTCVGVGDMSGDVFGNGMLRSKHTRLVAAFDHRHIFLDPDPDPAKSFAERQRLFDLPRSSWADYDKTLISHGRRHLRAQPQIDPALAAKSAPRLGIAAEQLTPTELIQAILKAPVDLLWFGGIGTYRQGGATRATPRPATAPTTACASTATTVRASVVGEGANLGVTQRGRIEYALEGRAHQHRRDRQFRRRRHLRPRGQHQDPAERRRRRGRSDA